VTIRSELFVATRRHALRFARRREAAGPPDYVRIAGHGLLPDDLESLWATLLGEPLDSARHQLENLRFGPRNPTGWRRLRRRLLILAAVARTVTGGEGADSGLYRFPPAYVRLLAALDDAALDAAVRDLNASPAWRPAAGHDARTWLAELRGLARHSVASGRPMFLWGETVPVADATERS
jgi:hypothetical protein